ncbi:CFEM domain-containing protein [Microdochium nivale]|nr:CFEM domain-containing protein [Microdochium nivale]
MRFLAPVVLFFSLLGLTFAQAGLPECSIDCFKKGIALSTCAATDTPCHCADTAYTNAVSGCVAVSCKIEDLLVVKNMTNTQCGIEPNNNTVAYNVIVTILMALSCLFVIIRVVYKQFLTQMGLGPDDWAMVATLIVCIPSAVTNVQLAEYGIGKDIWTLTPEQITNFSRTFWIVSLLYFTEVAMLKVSILFFYLRIFPDPAVRRMLWGTLVVIIIFGISFVLAAALQCRPVSYNWTSWREPSQKAQCRDSSVIAWANAGISIALDLWMLYLPLSQVRSLNLHWKKKVGVAAMVVVGTFVTVISIVRLASLVKFRKTANTTNDYWGVTVWSTVEITVGIMCACMPSMRVILVRIWPRLFGSSSYASNSQYANHYAKGSKNRTGTGSQVDNPPSKNKSAVRSSWKPKFSKRPDLPVDGPFGKPSQHQSRLERIDSDDDATELRPTNYKTHITSSAASEHGSNEEHDPNTITMTRDVTIKY